MILLQGSPGARLKKLADEVSDTLLIVMRVYFEKPRTSTGWKGFINDPFMDDSFHIEQGMQKARQFLLDVNELGLPAATEALDPIAPQYYGDLIARRYWRAHLNHKPTAKWLRVYRRPSVLKTPPMAHSMQQLTASSPRLRHTVSFARMMKD